MTRKFTIEVLGTPAPQGSKRHVGGGGMVESSKAVGPWRDSVAYGARQALPLGWQPLDGPLAVTVEFRLPMVRSRQKKVRVLGRVWKPASPDIDKLLRSTFDGLTTAGVWVDDARVCSVLATKIEVTGRTGARFIINELPPLGEE